MYVLIFYLKQIPDDWPTPRTGKVLHSAPVSCYFILYEIYCNPEDSNQNEVLG